MSRHAAGIARRRLPWTFVAAAALLAAVVPALHGCAPAIVAVGVGSAALVATDRRTAGAQLDDETIEVKLATGISNRWGDKVHVNVTSYNGIVLLTGEVPTAAIQTEIVDMTKATDRVKSVQNELVVGALTELSARTNDSYVTSKVKSRFVEANKFAATQVKVVTERGVVYLMGIVSHQEGDAAGQIAATTTGVVRVVKVFQYSN
jgi:osmotically-inducible protein OsmY